MDNNNMLFLNFFKIDQSGSIVNCKKPVRPNSKATNEHYLNASERIDTKYMSLIILTRLIHTYSNATN